jgi:hypothetical protein
LTRPAELASFCLNQEREGQNGTDDQPGDLCGPDHRARDPVDQLPSQSRLKQPLP